MLAIPPAQVQSSAPTRNVITAPTSVTIDQLTLSISRIGKQSPLKFVSVFDCTASALPPPMRSECSKCRVRFAPGLSSGRQIGEEKRRQPRRRPRTETPGNDTIYDAADPYFGSGGQVIPLLHINVPASLFCH